MNNIFLVDSQAPEGGAWIHEKYDIKGSWVSRNATPPQEGKMVTCTYCEQRFTYHRKNGRRNKVKM